MKSKSNVGPLINESSETGWIERQIIRNKIREMITKLDQLVPRVERWPLKEVVLEMLTSLEGELLSKHTKSTQEIFQQTAILKRPNEPLVDQRAAHEARMAQIKSRS